MREQRQIHQQQKFPNPNKQVMMEKSSFILILNLSTVKIQTLSTKYTF